MEYSRFFKSLTDKEISYLKSISRIEEKKEGDIIFWEGDDIKNTFFLIEGVVKIYKTSNNGNDITLNYILPPSFIGEFAVIKGIKYPLSAEMESNGKLLVFETKGLTKFIEKNKNFMREIIMYLANKIEKNYNYCEDLMEKNAKKKVAKFIKEHEDLFFSLKHTKIASILNITPETLSRTLRELKNEGLIEEKKIVKINKSKLESLLND
ncbi:Crp/Fnr family transcriptional regulator [Persephonella sp.]